jgi:glutaconate CoA-transferase, subunit A
MRKPTSTTHPTGDEAEDGPDKTMTMAEAVTTFVRDGDTIALEGFSHLVPVAAGHEIIRQRVRDLTVVRINADIVIDQMVAAGSVTRLLSAFIGNSNYGSLSEIRRRVETAEPQPLELEEYSVYGLICRYMAGAMRLPFMPLRSYAGSDIVGRNPTIRRVRSPYDDEEIYVVPPLNPDVAVVHAQRADRRGNTQMWGLTGIQAEAVYASRRAVVVVEEVVPDHVVRSDPNRTLIPGHAVDAVVECPRGAHPSYAQGYYDRDGDFYREWTEISKDRSRLQTWLDEWILGTRTHEEFIDKLGAEYWSKLTFDDAYSMPVNYGRRRSGGES